MLLERGLGSLWLEGEISNLSRPGSGHWYFSLKDAAAQVRCAMFRQRNLMVRFPVRDGAQVLARGRVSLYEPRGEFQVVIEHLEEAGEGLLRRRFEELKQKLTAEGLFDTPAQAAVAAAAATHRRDHLAHGRCRPRHPAHPAAPLPGRPGAHLPGRGAGRRGAARDRAGNPAGRRAARLRRADRGARRRLARGPVGLQRRGGRARDLRLPDPGRQRRRPRGRRHDRRLRRRRARADAFRGRRARGAGSSRVVADPGRHARAASRSRCGGG